MASFNVVRMCHNVAPCLNAREDTVANRVAVRFLRANFQINVNAAFFFHPNGSTECETNFRCFISNDLFDTFGSFIPLIREYLAHPHGALWPGKALLSLLVPESL